MEKEHIRNPKQTQFSNAYDCEILVDGEWISFTAVSDDVEPIGVEVHRLINSGECGAVEQYNWDEHWLNKFSKEKEELLTKSAVSNQIYNELDEQDKDDLTAYRKAIKAITYEYGSGEFTNWPEPPPVII